MMGQQITGQNKVAAATGMNLCHKRPQISIYPIMPPNPVQLSLRHLQSLLMSSNKRRDGRREGYLYIGK